MKFYVVETLTGKIRGRLHPYSWTLSDPLREVGTGTLTIAKPQVNSELRELVWPRHSDGLGRTGDRWVAAEDDTGAFVWCGPILTRPMRSEAGVTIRLADWRTWFYRAPLRPNLGDYIVKDRDQITIAKDLLTRSLTDNTGYHLPPPVVPPPIKVVTPPASGVLRDRTLRQLDRTTGDLLDDIVDSARGIEWWTYCTRSLDDPTVLELWVTTAYPERTKRTAGPVRVEWQLGKGGNVAEEPSWPDTGETITRMWATGDGEPPDQVYSRSEDTDATVLWEGLIGPLDGVKRSRQAYSQAFAERVRAGGYAANAEFVLSAKRLPFNDVAPGDRARVVYDDGWEAYDVPAARIVERVMSGGVGVADLHRLVIDLSDVVELTLDDPGTPGVAEDA